jgi:hypothetical protein
MRSVHTRRHHPLLAAGTAVEHLVLRHFGLRLTRHETEDPAPRGSEPAGRATPR